MPENTVEITINGQKHTVPDKDISYEDVVALSHPDHPDVLWTVVYHKRKGEYEANGSLIPGKTTPVAPDMRISIAFTGNA